MAVEKFGASERFACALLGQNRSAFRKKKPDMGFEEMQLRAALRAVAGKHPAWGWRKARWHLLAQPEWDGVALNRKRVRRLWRDEGLTCKPKARKKRRTGPGAGEQKRLTAEYPMHVVSFDFQSDVTSCGRHIRFFNVIDESRTTVILDNIRFLYVLFNCHESIKNRFRYIERQKSREYQVHHPDHLLSGGFFSSCHD